MARLAALDDFIGAGHRIERISESELTDAIGVVIAAGGDASLLRALAVAAPAGVAVLGVNVGGRGALADVEPAELTAALDVVASGRHRVADAKEVRMSDPVTQYLNQIGVTALLTAYEERQLSQAIEQGRDAQTRLDAGENSAQLHNAVADAGLARDRFICANLRLVVSIARRYPRPPSMDLLDLCQEGNLGLARAVEMFDWRRGLKFSTYATYWIRQAIARALNQKASLIRLPDERSVSLRAALRHGSGDAEELDEENARLYRLVTPTSLDRPVGDQDTNGLVDMLAADVPTPEQLLVHREDKRVLHDLLAMLPARSRLAVEHRFGLADGRKRSYREVGERLGVTAEAARRLIKRAVDTVRQEALAHT